MTPDPGPSRRSVSEARARLEAIAARARASFADNLGEIDAAVRDLEAGALDEETRRAAERAAHRIAGAAGTFGLPDATEPARAIELAFAGHPSPLGAPELARRASDLRKILLPPEAASTARPTGQANDRLLAVHVALPVATEMRWLATARSLGVTSDWTEEDVEAAIIDLDAPDAEALTRSYTMRRPAVPVVVLADTGSLDDRLRAARAGAHLVLPRGGPAAEPIDAVQSLLGQRHDNRLRVLAVDDDPVVLDLLREVLAAEPVQVSTLDDPRAFWTALERDAPDLVVLDLDMPHLDGIELCRMIRTDPHWSGLPVLFLTGHTSTDTVDAVFAAGADDYVRKPFNPTELRARIRNRLERAEMYRRLADTDPLTGVANRRRLDTDFRRLSTLARRYRQPLSLAVLDIDHFKRINDTHGHGVGDEVLCRLTSHLSSEFRGEDVVARLGGDEVAVLAFGMAAADAAVRLAGVLDSADPAVSPPEAQPPLTVSVSAGVAELDGHGYTLDELIRAADTALYDAKRAGRGRVVTADGEHRSTVQPSRSRAAAARPEDAAVSDDGTLVDVERPETTGHSRLERVRTQELLTRTLPPAPARILDVGGGTGVHARWLAQAGYDVHRLNVIPEPAGDASDQGLALTSAVGDARQLDESDDSADALLLLGPLYHLLRGPERLRALRDAHRVLRPGGTVAVSVVSRHAALLAYATRAEQDAGRLELALETLVHGRHHPTSGVTTAFFHTPDEIAAELRLAGFRQVRVLPVEGPMWTSVKTCTDPMLLDRLTESAVVCARFLEEEPAMLAASAHLLAIGHV